MRAFCSTRRPQFTNLTFGHERPRVGDVGPDRIGRLAERNDRSIVRARLGGVAHLLRSFRGANLGAEAVRLFREGRLERCQRLRRHAALEQHLAVELARRRRNPRRDRMLIGRVLGIRRGAHGPERLIVLALGVEHPGCGDVPLDIDLSGPIGVLRVATFHGARPI